VKDRDVQIEKLKETIAIVKEEREAMKLGYRGFP